MVFSDFDIIYCEGSKFICLFDHVVMQGNDCEDSCFFANITYNYKILLE